MGGFSAFGDSFKPTIGANSLYACIDSDDDLMVRQMEHIFLKKLETAQDQGIIHSGPITEFKIVREGDCSFAGSQWNSQSFQAMEYAVDGEEKRTGPSQEELISHAIAELPGMTEEKLKAKLEEEGEAAVQKLKEEVEAKLTAKAEEAVRDMIMKKALLHKGGQIAKKLEGYMDTMLAPFGYHGLKKGWMITKLLAKVTKIAIQMK